MRKGDRKDGGGGKMIFYNTTEEKLFEILQEKKTMKMIKKVVKTWLNFQFEVLKYLKYVKYFAFLTQLFS